MITNKSPSFLLLLLSIFYISAAHADRHRLNITVDNESTSYSVEFTNCKNKNENDDEAIKVFPCRAINDKQSLIVNPKRRFIIGEMYLNELYSSYDSELVITGNIIKKDNSKKAFKIYPECNVSYEQHTIAGYEHPFYFVSQNKGKNADMVMEDNTRHQISYSGVFGSINIFLDDNVMEKAANE